MWLKTKPTGPQLLVHVSVYQGFILVPVFWPTTICLGSRGWRIASVCTVPRLWVYLRDVSVSQPGSKNQGRREMRSHLGRASDILLYSQSTYCTGPTCVAQEATCIQRACSEHQGPNHKGRQILADPPVLFFPIDFPPKNHKSSVCKSWDVRCQEFLMFLEKCGLSERAGAQLWSFRWVSFIGTSWNDPKLSRPAEDLLPV